MNSKIGRFYFVPYLHLRPSYNKLSLPQIHRQTNPTTIQSTHILWYTLLTQCRTSVQETRNKSPINCPRNACFTKLSPRRTSQNWPRVLPRGIYMVRKQAARRQWRRTCRLRLFDVLTAHTTCRQSPGEPIIPGGSELLLLRCRLHARALFDKTKRIRSGARWFVIALLFPASCSEETCTESREYIDELHFCEFLARMVFKNPWELRWRLYFMIQQLLF